MVFIMNREGTIVETVTSPVHQGSNANEILLLAPFAPKNTVTVGFKLPNGILIQPRLSKSGTGETMTALEVNDLFLKIGADEESMSAWYIKINRDLTRYSGELGIQFFIYDGAGDILASSYATVTVQKGVAILDGTTFDTGTATQLQAALDKVYAALTAVKTDISTLQTDMSGAKEEITILKSRMDLAETDIGTLQTDMSVANDEISDLKESKLDKTGGTVSGDLDVAGNLFVNGKNYDTTVSSLKDSVDFLSTLLFNTIITLTDVEDNYATRVTAGGLPVVSNTPTTVHKIAGDTKASENLFDLSIEAGTYDGITVSSNNNTWTLSGTPTSQFATLKSVTLPSWLGGKTVTISQSTYFADYNKAGAVYISIVKISPWTTVATSITESKTVTLEEGATYRLMIMNGNTSNFEEETVSFMVNLGETALPYSDYYAGLKKAAFNGIASTGSNLVDIYGKVTEGITKYGVTIAQEQDGYLHFSGIPTGSYRVLFTISQDLFQDGETYTFAQSDYFGKYGSAYKNKNAMYWKVSRKNLVTGEMNYSLISTDAVPGSVTFDKTTYSYNIDIVTGSYAYTSGDEMNISLRFWINLGSTALTYEDYTTDTSFQLSAARQLRKWDYIDIDNQRLVTGTAEVTQDTAFTDEELATYPAGYILSADRKTIVYPLETPTTAPLTVPKNYTAWRNGSETVDTGAADALPPTITQTYYEEVTA